eukprot:COSAG01_NODE_21028_length_922_cov_0.562576_1_plen_258_part_01
MQAASMQSAAQATLALESVDDQLSLVKFLRHANRFKDEQIATLQEELQQHAATAQEGLSKLAQHAAAYLPCLHIGSDFLRLTPHAAVLCGCNAELHEAVRSKEDELAATTHELRLRELDTQRMEGELRAFQTLEPEVTQLRQQLDDLQRQLERERVAHERELRDVKEVHKTAGGWGLHLCVCLRPKDCISPEARLIGRAPAHIYGAPPAWCFVADTQDMFQYRGALEREFQAMTANFVQPKLASSGGSSFSDLGRTSS